MGDVQGNRLGEQQGGKTLIELLKGDRRNQFHHVGEALGKKLEYIAAERFVLAEQTMENSDGQHHHFERCFNNAARLIRIVTQQTTAGQDAALARDDAIQLQFAPVAGGFDDAQTAGQ